MYVRMCVCMYVCMYAAAADKLTEPIHYFQQLWLSQYEIMEPDTVCLSAKPYLCKSVTPTTSLPQ
jgi:hypothetical protein